MAEYIEREAAMNVREKLVELLTDNLPRYGNLPRWDNPLQLSCDEQVQRIADHLIMNGVTVQEWISVDERLPETQVEVLTYSDCNGVRSACLLASNEETNMWYLCRTDKLSIDVTYWQPMPQPPKGE